MDKRFIIILEGPMGAGKTTIANLLHPKLPRTALLGMDKIKWFLSDFERTDKDNDLIGRVMLAMAKAFLKEGCNLLIHQGFWKKEFAQPFIDLAEEFKANLHFYQLQAPVEILKDRARNRPDTPNKSPMTAERIEKNLKKWLENRYELGKTFDTDKLSPEAVAETIIKDVGIF